MFEAITENISLPPKVIKAYSEINEKTEIINDKKCDSNESNYETKSPKFLLWE